jgi:hypothetical protein
MKQLGTLALVSLFAPALQAQTPTFTLQTRGEYGVVVDVGAGEIIDGLPDASVITATTRLHTSVRGAHAGTTIRLATSRHGRGVVVEESGAVCNRSTEGEFLAGTLDEEGHHDHSAPHTLSLIVEGSTATEGTVTITWGAWATDHAEAGCSVDLNDDQIPDFEGEANARPVVQEFRVQRLGRRFLIHLTTQAEAEIEGRGVAGYLGGLGIYFREGAPSSAVTPYGTACGGTIAGTLNGGDAVVTLSGAAADSFGLVLIGLHEANIGIGNCTLLTLPVAVVPFRTDAQGAATHNLRLPAVGVLDLRVQDLIVASGIATSNGLRIERR